MDRERFFDPNQMDGGFGDDQLRSSHDARTISERIRGQATDDAPSDDGMEPVTTQASVEEQRRHEQAALRNSDQGAQDRVQIGRKFTKFIDRPSIQDALEREAARRQTAFAKAEARLYSHNMAGAYAESFADRDSVPPEQCAPDVQAPKPATGFAVTSNSRLSRKQRAAARPQLQRQVELDKIRNAIQARIKDRPTAKRDADIGAQLETAKELLGHGAWENWLAMIPMPSRTAQVILQKRKESSFGKSAA